MSQSGLADADRIGQDRTSRCSVKLKATPQISILLVRLSSFNFIYNVEGKLIPF